MRSSAQPARLLRACVAAFLLAAVVVVATAMPATSAAASAAVHMGEGSSDPQRLRLHVCNDGASNSNSNSNNNSDGDSAWFRCVRVPLPDGWLDLRLEKNTRVLHEGFDPAYLGDDVQYWHGAVASHPRSLVRLSATTEGCIQSGLVALRGAGTTSPLFALESHPHSAMPGPAAACAPLRVRPLTAADIDALKSMAPAPRDGGDNAAGTCGGAAAVSAQEIDRAPETTANRRRSRRSSSNSSSAARADAVAGGEAGDGSPAGQSSPTHTSCPVFLDADARFLAAWGGDGSLAERRRTAALKMIDVLFQVDGLYQHDDHLAGALSFRVAGVAVHDTLDFGVLAPSSSSPGAATADPAGRLLGRYQRWLATSGRAGDVPPQAVCLNHLFTHTNLNGVLGVAVQASARADVVGGLCDSRVAGGRMLNAGVTSTMTTRDAAVATWQTVLSTAHEVVCVHV